MNLNPSPMVLLTVEGFKAPPSLELVANRLNISEGDIDSSFGVVLLDPQRGLYCVQVPQDKSPEKIDVEAGPWSSPPIIELR